jgi:hypothetical protein
MTDTNAPSSDRLKAAGMLLDRAFGKAQQVVNINHTTNELSDQELINAVQNIHAQLNARNPPQVVEATLDPEDDEDES